MEVHPYVSLSLSLCLFVSSVSSSLPARRVHFLYGDDAVSSYQKPRWVEKKNFFYVLTKVFCRINYLRLHWHYSKIFDTGPVTKITLNFRYRLRLENHILKAMCMKERKLNVTSLRNCVTFSYVILRNLRLNCMNRSIGWCMQFSSYNNKVRFRFEFRHQVYTLFAGHFPKPRE